MPMRMTLTLPGETTPVYTPELVAPGDYSGFFDYANGLDRVVFVVVACAARDTGGLVFDLPRDELPVDGYGGDHMMINDDTLSLGTLKAGIDAQGSYAREVLTHVGMTLRAGRLLVEHFIEN